MALPKLAQPTYEAVIPSTKKKIKYRPMLVKEEKVLLMAKQSGQTNEHFSSILQIVEACILTEGIDVSQLSLVDISYLFTQIRANSISNMVKVFYLDPDEQEKFGEEAKPHEFELDLLKVTVTEAAQKPEIDLGNDVVMTLRYPPISIYTKSEFFDLADEEVLTAVTVACMDKIYQGETVHNCKDSTKEELQEYVANLPAKVWPELEKFFAGIPTLFYEIKFTNKLGKERKLPLKTLDDFFMFG